MVIFLISCLVLELRMPSSERQLEKKVYYFYCIVNLESTVYYKDFLNSHSICNRFCNNPK